MNTRVGAACCVRYDSGADQSLQHCFELTLTGASVGLELPPCEVVAEVLEYGVGGDA
jgi:hypothetical protein